MEVSFYILLTVLRNPKVQRNEHMVGTRHGRMHWQGQLILFSECNHELLESLFPLNQYAAHIEIGLVSFAVDDTSSTLDSRRQSNIVQNPYLPSVLGESTGFMVYLFN